MSNQPWLGYVSGCNDTNRLEKVEKRMYLLKKFIKSFKEMFGLIIRIKGVEKNFFVKLKIVTAVCGELIDILVSIGEIDC